MEDENTTATETTAINFFFQLSRNKVTRTTATVIPLLKQSFYAASFPSYDDKITSKSLVESMTGLLVGDASTSPSLRKMEALGESNVFGQGEVIALRTLFSHTSGK